VEARLHRRGRESSFAKTSSDAMDLAVPFFNCW
jgi:hypothetical protein